MLCGMEQQAAVQIGGGELRLHGLSVAMKLNFSAVFCYNS